MRNRVRVGIVGGTGYTGVELLRLMSRHPGVDVVTITSRAGEGIPFRALFPTLPGHFHLAFPGP